MNRAVLHGVRLAALSLSLVAIFRRNNTTGVSVSACKGCVYASVLASAPKDLPVSPCNFCVRNPLHPLYEDDDHRWPDGSEPLRVPMDAYHSVDMRHQMDQWVRDAESTGEVLVQGILRRQGLVD